MTNQFRIFMYFFYFLRYRIIYWNSFYSLNFKNKTDFILYIYHHLLNWNIKYETFKQLKKVVNIFREKSIFVLIGSFWVSLFGSRDLILISFGCQTSPTDSGRFLSLLLLLLTGSKKNYLENVIRFLLFCLRLVKRLKIISAIK